MKASAAPLFLLLCASCGSRGAAEVTPSGPVPEGFVARVGADVIARGTVEGVAAAQNITARAALDRSVSDALLAAEARRRLHRARVNVAERRTLSRLFLQETWAEAQAVGPPTDAEVKEETARRWWEIDRPVLARATHAVVLSKPGEEARVRAFATRVATALASATDAGTFHAAAAGLKEDGLDFRVEDLDPVAENGSTLNLDHLPPPGSRLAQFDPDFVKAVFKIPAVGRQSGIVKSSFGFHVILLTELVPEHRVPLEERRALLAQEIVQKRASKLRDAALDHASDVDHVELERAAGELTEKVNVSP